MLKALTATTLFSLASAAGGKVEYDYLSLGKDWGSLKDQDGNRPYAMCDDGQRQSPIDFQPYDVDKSSEIEIDLKNYQDYENIEITFAKGSAVKVMIPETVAAVRTATMELTFDNGQSSEWNPLQFHFHTPSEHTVQGYNYDLEMHIVHLTPTGGLGAVLGVFFDVERGGNEENWFLSQMGGLRNSESSFSNLSLKSWLDNLDLSEFWSYNGSLTTPPCTEGVKWSVLKSVQPISREQLALFNREWANGVNTRGNGDNRVTQPLNGRQVFQSGWESNEMENGMLIGGILLGISTVLFMLAAIAVGANSMK